MALRNRKLGTIEALHGQILQETDAGAVVDNERVFQGGSGTKYEDISSQTYKTSIAKIRASQTLNPNITYITTDFGVPVEWQVDESDTTSVDNTGTILVTADGVRLKARTKGVIDCRQFGIIPDGATPVGDALQSMINSLQNETIELHPGVYILDKKVTIPNNKQLVIRGTGKFEAASPNQAGGVGDGIVTIRYTGTTDDCAIEFLGECRTDLSRFTLVNDSGRNDVDGIKTQDLLRSCIEEVTITRFRRCFWITGWFYYSKFDHCRFRLAYEAGFYAEGLCNGTKFHRCHFI